jgi:uncharacterized membrane protein
MTRHQHRHDTTPEELALRLLGRPFADLDEDEQLVLRHVVTTKPALMLDERAVVDMSLGDRLADGVAAVGGSWGFIIWFLVTLVGWMVINIPPVSHILGQWDPYPFIFLNLMLSMLAAIQAPVIMMSQNRQSFKDRIHNRHDYEVNLRTTIEIMKLQTKLERITATLVRIENGVKGDQPPAPDAKP